MEKKNLNDSIITIRVNLQNAKLKKSGKNKYAGFDYYELADFLPKLNELMLEEGVNDNFIITNEIAKLILIKGEEKQEYTMPFVLFDTPLTKDGKPSMQDIQYLGALNTYYKRYLYLNAFGITDGEVIDSMDNSNMSKKNEIKATEAQITLLNKINDELKERILKKYEVNDLSELSITQASEIIKFLKKGNQ